MTLRGIATVLLLVAATTLAGTPASAGRSAPGLATAGARAGSTVVATDAGLVRGSVDGEVRRFQNIPFARPPVGELRWRPPRPAKPWTGVRDATTPAPQCAQLAPVYGGATSFGEDCLYLNVTTPANARRLPVMVWLHGGGNVTGRASVYDGATLAADGDVVVVTVNYRLGVFGWLAHPGFESSGQQAGNYGLLDQQAALRWVARNAHAFGGDPGNVTLFGESAGSEDTCANLVSPAARGLFHRAIPQSYACGWPMRDEQTAEHQAARVAETVGCADAACLRGLDAETLLDAFASTGAAAGPVAGNALLPRQPAEAIESGRFNRMPVMHGNTIDEMRLFVSIGFPTEITAAQYEGVIRANFGQAADAVLARYPVTAYPTPRIALSTVQSDFGSPLSTCSHLEAYERLDDAGVPVYAYQFADRAAPPLLDVPDFDEGAEHASELTYLWPGLLGALSPDQQRLSEVMVAYWTSFAHRGRPQAPQAPRWPEFDRAAQTLSLDTGHDGVAPKDVSVASGCEFWAGLTVR
jgi:para-nitrobenzyl esterase